MVAVNTRAGVTKLWGYPALVKVRQASARLVPVPWESALWFEQDTLRSASSERTGVFAASTLCAAFGSNVVAEAEAAAMAIYEQSTDPDEFAVSAASPDGPSWLSHANLPLDSAYGRELIDIVGGIVGEVAVRPVDMPIVDVPSYRIRCGRAKVRAFVNALGDMVR